MKEYSRVVNDVNVIYDQSKFVFDQTHYGLKAQCNSNYIQQFQVDILYVQ